MKDISSLRCNPVRSFPECKVRFYQTINVCFSVKTVQSWDLVQQTQNYLKLLLHIINSDGRCVFLVVDWRQLNHNIKQQSKSWWKESVPLTGYLGDSSGSFMFCQNER